MAIDDKACQLKRLMLAGKSRGYVLCDEIDAVLPEEYEGGRELDDLLSELQVAGIEILDEPKAELFFDQKLAPDFTAETDDPVQVYLRELDKIPRLPPDVEIELSKRIGGGDEDAEGAKIQFLEANLRLVVTMAERYSNRGVHLLDLIQEGNTGLMKAVEHFDYRRGYKFSAYATWWVHRAITRATGFR